MADGIIIGIAFLKDGYIWNPLDGEQVILMMDRGKVF